MPRYNDIVNSFVSGEVTPKLQGRTDLNVYKTGVETLENMIVMQQGGTRRRPGTIYLKTKSSKNRLIPFIFSNDESYLVELDDSSITITNTTDYFNCTVTFDTVPTGFNVLYAYSDSELNEVQYQQVGDWLILTHPMHEPTVIARTSENNFIVYPWYDVPITTTNAIETRFPFRPENITAATITTSGTTGAVYATYSGGAGFWQAGHVGAVFRKGAVGDGYFVVTGVTVGAARNGGGTLAAGQANILFINDVTSASATTTWAEGAWSNYRGYPRCVAYHQERVWYASNSAQPDRFWLSKYLVLNQFEAGSNETDPYSATINSSPFVNQINWMCVQKQMIMGTLGAEHVINGVNPSDYIGPTNPPNINADTIYGSLARQPIRYDSLMGFISRAGRKLVEFTFNFNEDQFQANDIMLLADHITEKQLLRIVPNPPINTVGFEWLDQLAWQSNANVIWATDRNGGFFSCTRDKSNQITGWAFHKIAGESDYGPAYVHSVCVTPPPPNETQDIVWLCVERVINGSTVFTIERLASLHDFPIFTDPGFIFNTWHIFSDCSLIKEYQTGGRASDLFIAEHLAGETVVAVGDGQYLGEIVVQYDAVNGVDVLDGLGDAEGNAVPAEFIVYDDGASATPVDGIGGTTSCTLTINSATPMTGVYSFRMSRPASNVQGEGWSWSFTIPEAMAGQAYKISFEATGGGGGYPIIYLYDVDNGTFIDLVLTTPDLTYYNELVQGNSGTSIPMIDYLSYATEASPGYILFKTNPSSTNYRLIFHIDTTETTARDIDIDSLVIDAQGIAVLPAEVQRAVIGFNYESTIKTLKVDAGSQIGSAQGQPKKSEKTTIRFHNTVGAKYGIDEDNLRRIDFRPYDLDMDEATPAFSGDKTVDQPANWDREGQIIIKQDIPMPMSVLAIVRRGVSNE